MEESRILERRLCRLCGKQKEEKEFTEFTLTMIGKMPVRYRVCKSCDIVVHNASILIREAILQATREQDQDQTQKKKIITSELTLLDNPIIGGK